MIIASLFYTERATIINPVSVHKNNLYIHAVSVTCDVKSSKSLETADS